MVPCKDGKHTLIPILRAEYDRDCHYVAQWCRFCGAAVVDREVDGRTQPGAQMKMQFSQIMLDMAR